LFHTFKAEQNGDGTYRLSIRRVKVFWKDIFKSDENVSWIEYHIKRAFLIKCEAVSKEDVTSKLRT
jgi:hypothetical protein